MHTSITRRCVAALTIVASLASTASTTYADASRDDILSRITTMESSIQTAITTQDQKLLKSATDLSTLYDQRLHDKGISADDVDILFSLGTLTGANFRDDVTQQYLQLHTNLFTSVRATLATLDAAQTELSIGSSTLTDAKALTYTNTLSGALVSYNTFMNQSDIAISSFSVGYATRMDLTVLTLQQQILKNQDLLTFIHTVQSRYTGLEDRMKTLKSGIADIETNVLANLQNNISIMNGVKSDYRAQIESSLSGGLAKALQNPHLAQYRQDAQVFLGLTMGKWDDYMNANFQDDQNLLLEYMKAKNILNSEPAIRARIYDANGNIIFKDLTASGSLMKDIDQLSSDIDASTVSLAALKLRYANQTALGLNQDMKTALDNAYHTKLAEYQKSLTDYLTSLGYQQSVSEKNAALQTQNDQLTSAKENLQAERDALAQQQRALLSANDRAILNLMRLEDIQLRRIFVGSASYGYAQSHVAAELATVDSMAKLSTNPQIKALAQKLHYTYAARLFRRQLTSDASLVGVKKLLKTQYESTAKKAVIALEQHSGVEGAVSKSQELLTALQSLDAVMMGTGSSVPSMDSIIAVRRAIGNLPAGQDPVAFSASQKYQIIVTEAVLAEYLSRKF